MQRGLSYSMIKVSFGIGIILLMINIYGLFIPFKNEAIYEEEHVFFKNDIDRSYEYLISDILNEEITDREDFFRKLVIAVNKNMAHYWRDDGRFKYNLTVPFYKNYLLFMASYFMPKVFKKYEFCDYRLALERGVGLCSQHAIVICGILEEKGVPCRIVALSGHVVAMAEVKNDKWWILDGDYGVIIPYDIVQIEKTPSLVVNYYKDKLDYSDHAIKTGSFIPLLRLVEIYGKEGNRILKGVKEYCNIKKWIIEKSSFYAIWIIPLILMLPLIIKKVKESSKGSVSGTKAKTNIKDSVL